MILSTILFTCGMATTAKCAKELRESKKYFFVVWFIVHFFISSVLLPKRDELVR
jgi:hypothetical protein